MPLIFLLLLLIYNLKIRDFIGADLIELFLAGVNLFSWGCLH